MNHGVEDRAHPTTALNDVVHQRARLGILTVLQETERADFAYLKSVLQLTDGNLGRHIEVLAKEGFVSITKGYQGRRPRTWISITSLGHQALIAEMTTLKQLLTQYEHLRPNKTATTSTPTNEPPPQADPARNRGLPPR